MSGPKSAGSICRRRSSTRSSPRSDDAFGTYGVVFFRDQALTPAQQVRFGARFGPLNIHPYVAGMASQPTEVIAEVIKEPQDKINFGGGWHSDMSFLERPAIGSILYARGNDRKFGGDTLFAQPGRSLRGAVARAAEDAGGVERRALGGAGIFEPGESFGTERSSMAIAEA